MRTEHSYIQLGARTYDPEIGRFMSVDPLFEMFPEHSPYHYCYNSPLVYADPSGMFTETLLSLGISYSNGTNVTQACETGDGGILGIDYSNDDEDTRTGTGGGAAGASGIPQWMQEASARSEGRYWMSVYEWGVGFYTTDYSSGNDVSNPHGGGSGMKGASSGATSYPNQSNMRFVDEPEGIGPRLINNLSEMSQDQQSAVNTSLQIIYNYGGKNVIDDLIDGGFRFSVQFLTASEIAAIHNCMSNVNTKELIGLTVSKWLVKPSDYREISLPCNYQLETIYFSINAIGNERLFKREREVESFSDFIKSIFSDFSEFFGLTEALSHEIKHFHDSKFAKTPMNKDERERSANKFMDMIIFNRKGFHIKY